MLAYNIAYICYTQGLEVNDVDEACNMGKNLVQLLTAKDCTAATNPAFGRLSNTTIVGNIATVEGKKNVAGFNLGYKLVLERIRLTLQGETMVADWDLVSDAETDLISPKFPTRNNTTRIQQDDAKASASPSRRTSTAGSEGRWTRIRVRPEGEQKDRDK